MDITIKRTAEAGQVIEIAQRLPEFFDAGGLADIKRESGSAMTYGAYEGEQLLGFAIYKELNPQAVEMRWLAVSPEAQGKGVGTKLVEETIKELAATYEVCEVKTLAETDPYEPYRKTREFYIRQRFVPIEIVHPYPGWGDNPCQIFVRHLR